MSQLLVDDIVNKDDTGAPAFSKGVNISATTESTSSTTGALIVSGGVGIGKSLFIGGNISAGGTVTYEDVTNIDSVGIVTAGGGLYVGRTSIGATIHTTGNAVFAGILTASSFSGVESWNQQDAWLYGGG